MTLSRVPRRAICIQQHVEGGSVACLLHNPPFALCMHLFRQRGGLRIRQHGAAHQASGRGHGGQYGAAHQAEAARGYASGIRQHRATHQASGSAGAYASG
jgi:hypothetical protein